MAARSVILPFAAALDSSNAAVKKQAMDLLSSLCGHNQEGYQKVLDTFERYKAEKNDGSRFQLLVDELRQAKTSAYKTTLIALINAIICNNEALRSRIRIRNEFLALKVHDVLAQIRTDANPDDGDLFVQLDTFDEQKFADDANLSSPDGLDLTNVMDVFHAVLAQVANTPQEATFLNLLQHLLQVDPNVPLGNTVWSTAEKLVHRASLLETKEDADLLLRPPVNVNVVHNKVERLKSQHDLTSPTTSSMHLPSSDPPAPSVDTSPVSSAAAPPPPPPPPPMGGPLPPMGAGAPPPPPPPVPGSADPNKGHKAPTAPAPPKAPLAQSSLPSVSEDDSVLPQQNVPKPKTRLKTFNWNKIPVHKVLGRDNLWTKTTSGRSASIDFGAMEELFAAPQSDMEKVKDVTTEIERKRKDSNEINLLDSKRSLNVNIFLKQFRTAHETVIDVIKAGKWEQIGAEKLRGLLKILPESDEVDMLKSYEGSVSRLGTAEKFLLQLVQVPNYKLRIEAMLFQSEYQANVDYLRPCVDFVILTALDIKKSTRLHETLHMVLLAGNFLNTGGYAGNAAGFKLSSLLKLVDIRSNKPSMNLMHCIAEQAASTNPLLLNFPDDMEYLHEAAKLSTENLIMEIKGLYSKCQRLTEQLETADEEVKEKMLTFLEHAKNDLNELNEDALEMERLRVEMAEFFCEDAATFKLEDCFKILHSFCQKFRKAVQENEQRKVQEEKAESRRLEEQEKRMRRHAAGELSDSAIDSSRSSWNTIPRHMSDRHGSTSDNESGSVFRRDSILDNGYASDTGAKKRARRMIRSSDEDDLMEYLTQGAEVPSARSSARPLLGEILPSFGRHSLRSRPARSHDASIDNRERSTSTANKVTVPNNSPQKIEEWLHATESMNGSLSGSQMRLTQVKSSPTARPGNLLVQNPGLVGTNGSQPVNGFKSQPEQPAPVVSPVRSQQQPPFQPNPIGYESTGRISGNSGAAKPTTAVNGKWNPESGDQKSQSILQPRPWVPSKTLANTMHVFDPKAGCPGEPLGSGTASPASSSSENVQPMGGRSGEETDTETLNGSDRGRKQLTSAASQRLRKWRRLPATNGKSIDEEVLTDTSLDDAPRSTGLSVRNQNPYDSARKQTRTLREMRENKRNSETQSARRAASFGPTDRVRRVRDVPKSDSEDVPNGVVTPVKTATTGGSVFDRLSAPKRSSPPLERSTAISPGNGIRKPSVPLLNGKRRGSGKNSDDNGSDDAKSCVTAKSHNSDGSSASTNSSASRANRSTTRVTLSSRTPTSSMTRPGELNVSGRTRSGAQKNPDGSFTTRVTDYTLQSPESPKVVKAALVLSAPATSRLRH